MKDMVADTKQELIEELQYIEDPQERFAYIIDRAKDQQPLDEAFKIDEFLIKGCVSLLWLHPRYEEGKCYFQTDADAMITKGIAGMVAELYSGGTPEEVLAEDASFLGDLGITQHLSPNRRNGLSSLIGKCHAYARFCQEEYAPGKR